MLAGQYPSDEFADLKPRVIWDRATDIVSRGAMREAVAIVNAGTIPDRGSYGVFLGERRAARGRARRGDGVREPRRRDVPARRDTWRIEQITRDRVIVSPAPGEPGKMPFWKGDGVGRPLEFGRAIGAFTREIEAIRHPEEALERLEASHDLDERAARNLLAYLDDEKEATGALPTDRSIVVERFRDELGDWRVVHPDAVRRAGACAVGAGDRGDTRGARRLRRADDLERRRHRHPLRRRRGAARRGHAAPVAGRGGGADRRAAGRQHDVRGAGSARTPAGHCCCRACGRARAARSGMQRQRAANLLAVASRYGSFPIILETYRECLRDVFDLPALTRSSRRCAAARSA